MTTEQPKDEARSAAQRPALTGELGAGMPYVLRKHGMFYALDSCGYTNSIFEAELYTKEYAEAHARGCEEVIAAPAIHFIGSYERWLAHLDRIDVLRVCVEAPNVQHEGCGADRRSIPLDAPVGRGGLTC